MGKKGKRQGENRRKVEEKQRNGRGGREGDPELSVILALSYLNSEGQRKDKIMIIITTKKRGNVM